MKTTLGPRTTWYITSAISVVLILGGLTRILALRDLDERLSPDTLLWFAAAAIVLVVPRIRSIGWGDARADFEKLEDEVQQARELSVAAENLFRSQAAIASLDAEISPEKMLASHGITPNNDPKLDDPWKGKFGGKSSMNRRSISASVNQIIHDPDWFLVHLTVTGHPGGDPLTTPVYFFLHDTFPVDRMVIQPENGRAELRLRAWGAFTVGAITDGGKTLLELDLAENKEFPALFRSR